MKMQKNSSFIAISFIFFFMCGHARHIQHLNKAQVYSSPKLWDPISSPAVTNRRQRKVMSQTFQDLINNQIAPVNEPTQSTNQNFRNDYRVTKAVNKQSFSNNGNFINNNHQQMQQNQFVNQPQIELKQGQDLRSHLINIINNMSPQQLSLNAQALVKSPQILASNVGQSGILSPKTTNTVNVQVVRRKKIQVPIPSLINPNVNGFKKPRVLRKPVITMVPKMKSQGMKQIIGRKRPTMIEKLKSIPALKPNAETTVQKVVSSLQKGEKVKIVALNNTSQLKIVNENATNGASTANTDPNFIVLKDITITNRTDGTNGTRMSVTLMSQATGGRPIVIEANSNIVLSQEKMANGTVQFIVRTDEQTKTTETTTVPTSTIPTEEPEIEAEETTTAAPPTTTGEV